MYEDNVLELILISIPLCTSYFINRTRSWLNKPKGFYKSFDRREGWNGRTGDIEEINKMLLSIPNDNGMQIFSFLIKWLYGALLNCFRIHGYLFIFKMTFRHNSIKPIEKLSRRHFIKLARCLQSSELNCIFGLSFGLLVSDKRQKSVQICCSINITRFRKYLKNWLKKCILSNWWFKKLKVR